MKKVLVALVALAGVSAFADGGARLQYESVPNSPVTKINTQRLVVDDAGRVIRSEIEAVTGKVLSSKEIARLENSELQHVNELIEQARNGRIETQFHPIHCKAISLVHSNYTADNGKVFLAREALCQDPTINVTPAARELVTLLKKYLRVPAPDTLRETEPSLYDCRGADDTRVIYTTTSIVGKPTFSVTFQGQRPKLAPFPAIKRVSSVLGDELTVTDNHLVPIDGPSVNYTLILPQVKLADSKAVAEFKTMLVKTSIVSAERPLSFTGPTRVNTFVEVACQAKWVVF